MADEWVWRGGRRVKVTKPGTPKSFGGRSASERAAIARRNIAHKKIGAVKIAASGKKGVTFKGITGGRSDTERKAISKRNVASKQSGSAKIKANANSRRYFTPKGKEPKSGVPSLIAKPGASSKTGSKGRVYTVRRGDNLTKIAKSKGMTLSQLLKKNPSLRKRPNLIYRGTKVRY